MPPKIAANIKVIVRVKPMAQNDVKNGGTCVIDVPKPDTMEVEGPSGRRNFTYDRCLWSCDEADHNFASQQMVFDEIGVPTLENAWDGYNCSVFA
jgi:kinesin family protein 1